MQVNLRLERLRQLLRRTPDEGEQQRLRMAGIADAYKTMYQTQEGEIVFRDLLRKGELLSAAIEATPELTAAAIGRRQLALHIVTMLGWTEAELLRFHQQQADDAMREAVWAQETAA